MPTTKQQFSEEERLIKICQAVTGQDKIDPTKKLSLILHIRKYPERRQSFSTQLHKKFDSKFPLDLIDLQMSITYIQMLFDKLK